jgi:hypothetical protein
MARSGRLALGCSRKVQQPHQTVWPDGLICLGRERDWSHVSDIGSRDGNTEDIASLGHKGDRLGGGIIETILD